MFPVNLKLDASPLSRVGPLPQRPIRRTKS
jgi:hypothetical protein